MNKNIVTIPAGEAIHGFGHDDIEFVRRYLSWQAAKADSTSIALSYEYVEEYMFPITVKQISSFCIDVFPVSIKQFTSVIKPHLALMCQKKWKQLHEHIDGFDKLTSEETEDSVYDLSYAEVLLYCTLEGGYLPTIWQLMRCANLDSNNDVLGLEFLDSGRAVCVGLSGITSEWTSSPGPYAAVKGLPIEELLLYTGTETLLIREEEWRATFTTILDQSIISNSHFRCAYPDTSLSC